MQSGECVLLEQPVEDVAVSNVLVVAEPDGIQGELCDVEETSICEYRSNSALSFAVGCNAFRYSEKDNGSILSSTYRPVKWMILRFFRIVR